MDTPRKLKSLAELKTLPALPTGRVYLAVAPFAWGKDVDPVKAVKKCRSHYSESYGGKFRFILHDAPASTFIDGVGHSLAEQADLDASGPAVVVGLYRTKPEDLN